MAAERATITLTMALFGVVFALHLQAQAAGAREAATTAGGQAGAAAEYVLLEPKQEQLPAVDALNATYSKPVCGRCRCCLTKTNPKVCLTTCCFQRICAPSVCTLPAVSCGCNGCDYPAGKE